MPKTSVSLLCVKKYQPHRKYSLNVKAKTFLDEVSTKLNISNLAQWYSVVPKDVKKFDKEKILQQDFNGSLFSAVTTAYPNQDWQPWKFLHENVPSTYWNKENQIKFMKYLEKELGIVELEDWYQLTSKHLREHGAGTLLTLYNNSPHELLSSLFPQHKWFSWKFPHVAPGFWTDRSNRIAFFEHLKEELNVKTEEDWYKVLCYDVFEEHRGLGLLHHYNNSPVNALSDLYPHYKWLPWKFEKSPRGFWKDKQNQRAFMEWLAPQLGVKQLEDWYQVLDKKTIVQYGGLRLLEVYDSSPFKAIQAIYPEVSWDPNRFHHRPRNYFNDPEKLSELIQDVATQLSIEKLDDWYRVSIQQLVDCRAYYILLRYGGLMEVLSKMYPEHQWDFQKFRNGIKKSSQRWLMLTLKEIFPSQEIMEDYVHPEMVFSETKQPVQLDVFIPTLRLAFEYQGIHHFQDVGVFAPHHQYKGRDEEKRKRCEEHHITLVEVPYVWDRKKDTLIELIEAKKPGLVTSQRKKDH